MKKKVKTYCFKVYGDGKITDPNKISKEIYEREGKKTIIYGDGRTETISKNETLEPQGSPLTNSEETNYVNFGYRAPAEKKKEEAPKENKPEHH